MQGSTCHWNGRAFAFWTRRVIVKEAISSEPAALVSFFEALGFAVKRIGLEAGPLSQWLHAGLKRAGFETVLLETRHVKAALSAMTVKTDRKDARGFAQLIRMGSFRRCMPNRSRPIRGYFESSTQFKGFQLHRSIRRQTGGHRPTFQKYARQRCGETERRRA
jgi:hypothetical protein